MKVHEIAKLTGKTSADVAKELGLPTGQGLAFTNVEDDVAADYVKARGGAISQDEASDKGAEPEAAVGAVARFWTPSRNRLLLGNEAKGISSIQFEDWVYECASDSPEAELLRGDYVRDALGIREVISKPYADAGKVADFIVYLESLIYTGQTKADGPSREGRDCVKAILPAFISSKLTSTEKNSPRTLARAVANSVSMNVDSFGIEE